MNEKELLERTVPRNRRGKQRVGELCRRRNLIEAVIFTGIILVPVFLIPFTFQAQVTLCIMLGGMSVFINLIGIKNRTVTEFLILYIKDKNTRRVLSLRSVANGKKRNKIEDNQAWRKTRFGKVAYEIILGWEEGEYDDTSDGSNESRPKHIAKVIRRYVETFRTNLGI